MKTYRSGRKVLKIGECELGDIFGYTQALAEEYSVT